MIVRGLLNCVVAGKCISGDQVAMSSYRMTPTCAAMGQAAGTGAALSLETDATDLREINTVKLQAILRDDGVETDPAMHTAFATEQTQPK